MKTIIKLGVFALLFSVFQSCIVSKNPNMAFFDNPHYDYSDAQFMSVNVPMWIAKPFIKNALKKEEDGEAILDLIRKISDVKVMTVQNGNPQMLNDFSKYLTNNRFEEWMTLKKDKEIINFQAKQKGDVIRKLLITVNSGNELVYVDVSGKFTPDDISKMVNYTEKNDVKKKISKP